MHYIFKGNHKRIILIATVSTIGIILIVTVGLSLFSSNANVVFNSKKTNINGDLHLTVGSLKGYYDIEQFSINQQEKVSIPYDVSVVQGEVALLVIDSSSKIVWAENITQSNKGIIEYNADAQDYLIKISTSEAKKIEINLKLK